MRALGAPARKRGRDRASVRLPRADASGKPSAGAGGARRERRREGASRANREHAGAAKQAEHARESEEATERAERTSGEGPAPGAPRAGQGAPAPPAATTAPPQRPTGVETVAAGLKSHCRTTLRQSAPMEQGAGFTNVNTSRFTNGNRVEHVHIELYMRAYTNGKAGRARAQGRREQRSHAPKERTESTQAQRERTSVQGAERTSRTRGHREEQARGRVEREPARPTHARHALGERGKRLISERVERQPSTRERATEGRGVQHEQAPIMRPHPARLASPTITKTPTREERPRPGPGHGGERSEVRGNAGRRRARGREGKHPICGKVAPARIIYNIL